MKKTVSHCAGRSFVLCWGEDSNLHGLPRCVLSAVRLPTKMLASMASKYVFEDPVIQSAIISLLKWVGRDLNSHPLRD